VTANDGELGEQYLREFQDNEKEIPTILTTSRKLSTGVDALNIRNIVLLRPIKTILEFKQIIGRGTRVYEGKDYFTVHDFVEAYEHFADEEWDGLPDGIDDWEKPDPPDPKEDDGDKEKRKLVEVKLQDGKIREIEYTTQTLYYDQQGKPISAEEFLKNIFGVLPNVFQDEKELRSLWSNPENRKKLLDGLASRGFGEAELIEIQKMTNNQYSDIFDVLSYIAFAKQPKLREERSGMAKQAVQKQFSDKELEFINFILSKYEVDGVWELGIEKLNPLIKLKYGSASLAKEELGEAKEIRQLFTNFQQYLYQSA
jgi:type I restriction enzyme R subunit